MDDSITVPALLNNNSTNNSNNNNNINNNPIITEQRMAPFKSVRRSGARRCLFGRPDPRNVDEWLTEEMNKIRQEQQIRLGFVFDPENPCASTINSKWEFTAVPADSVPQFYRTTYYGTDSKVPCDVENCIPCSSSNSNSINVNTVRSSDCFNATELSLLPTASASGFMKPSNKKKRSAKKQTKLTAFMNVDSRKRLRQQAKDSVDNDLLYENNSASTAASVPSPSKSMRLIGHCRSSV